MLLCHLPVYVSYAAFPHSQIDQKLLRIISCLRLFFLHLPTTTQSLFTFSSAMNDLKTSQCFTGQQKDKKKMYSPHDFLPSQQRQSAHIILENLPS